MNKLAVLDEFARNRHTTACGWARRYLKGGTLAEDAVQDALLHAAAKIDMYDPSLPFEPWMKRVLDRVCLQKLRQFRRRAPALLLEDLGGYDAPDEDDPIAAYLDMMERGGRVTNLMTAFLSLSPSDRDLVIDIYVHEVPVEDLAAGIGCRQDALRSKVNQIRRLFASVTDSSKVLAL
jgi:RNA polymerase sigma-70 factor (ECF subfamily)